MLPADGWELCPFVNGDETDCARDNVTGTAFQQPFLGWNNHYDIKIRKVDIDLEVDSEFILEIDYDVPPTSITYTAPDGVTNARFETIYPVAAITGLAVADVTETSARNFVDLTVVCEQDNVVESGFNIPSSNPDVDSQDCAPILNLDLNRTFTFTGQVEITADYYPQLPQWVAENNWDDALMMTYAPDFQPAGGGACTPDDGDTGTVPTDDCLVITNLGGTNNNIISLLVLAGEHDLLDGDDLNDDGDYLDANEVPPDDDFLNDMYDVFEPENYSGIGAEPVPENDPAPGTDTVLDLVFDKREDVVPGNAADTLFIIDQL